MKKGLFLMIPFLVLALASCNSNTRKKIVDENGEIAFKKSVSFSSDSNTFSNVKKSKIDTFYFDDETPYVTIDSFINGISYYDKDVIVSDDFDYSLNIDGYNKHLKLDYDNNSIIMYDFEFFSVDEMQYKIDPAYKKYLMMEITEEDEDVETIINLDDYNLKIKKFDNNLYIPFHIINAILSVNSYYYIYYLGDRYIGYSLADGYTTCANIKKYNKIKVDSKYSEYNYNFFNFAFNELYGLKYYYDFDLPKMIEEEKKGLSKKDDFISSSKRFISYLDDCHTSFNGYNDLFSFDVSYYPSDREKNLRELYLTLTKQFVSEYEKTNSGLTVLDSDTAIISFDEFVVDSKTGTIQTIKKHLDSCIDLGITNIIFDVTTNGGGDTFSLAQILGLLTNDDILLEMYNVRTNHYVNESFKVDANLDGDFTDLDAYTDFNYFILSSGFSYSCANLFINYCQQHNIAKIIGQRSGGGGCSIAPVITPSGALITFSSLWGSNDSNGILCEDGILPDYEISQENIYNKESLLKAVKHFEL